MSHSLGPLSESSPARLAGMITEMPTRLKINTEFSVDGRTDLREPEGPFIVQGANSYIGDPFTTSDSTQNSSHHGRITPTAEAGLASPIASTPSPNIPDNLQTSPETPFTPREDRIGQPVSSENAQALNPPDACIFVAK